MENGQINQLPMSLKDSLYPEFPNTAMKSQFRLSILSLLLGATLSAFHPISQAADTTAFTAKPLEWTNPIVPQRADPQVSLQADRYYYMTATVPRYDYIELRRASTIAGLSTAEPKVIWHRHVSGPMRGHIWTPELHRNNNKWYYNGAL